MKRSATRFFLLVHGTCIFLLAHRHAGKAEKIFNPFFSSHTGHVLPSSVMFATKY
jgi:hypothetical protein